jgi:Kef-type K+ transport system membrane component KefB
VSTAFSTDQAKTVGIFALAVIILAGVLLSFVFTKLTSRLVLGAIIVGLGIFTWTQRDAIDSDAKNCDATFFGVHLTPSNADLKRHCQQITR